MNKTEKILILHSFNIEDDVLDRLEDLEDFHSVDELTHSHIISINTMKRILEDKDDDTNETTKIRLEKLFNKCKGVHYLMIVF